MLLAALAACGSDGSADASTESPSASDSTSAESLEEPSEETVEQTATVNQYASIIAKNGDLAKQIEAMDDCDWLGRGSLDYDPQSIVCTVGVLTMSYQSMTLSLSLTSAQDSTAPAFIGAPPAEIETLVADTVTAADALAEVATATNDAKCEYKGTGKCSRLRADTWSAMSDLERELAGWRPYTG